MMLETYAIYADTDEGDPPIETMVIRSGRKSVEIVRIPWPLLILNFDSWIKSLTLEIQIAGVRAENRGDEKISDLGSIVGEQLILFIANPTADGLHGYPELTLRASVRPWTVDAGAFGDYLGAILSESVPSELTLSQLDAIQCVVREDIRTIFVVESLTPIADHTTPGVNVNVVSVEEIAVQVRLAMVAGLTQAVSLI